MSDAEPTGGLPPDPEYPVPTEIYAAVLTKRGEMMIGLINRVRQGEGLSIEEQVGVLHLVQEAINLQYETGKKIAELSNALSDARNAMVLSSNELIATSTKIMKAVHENREVVST